MHQAGMQAVGVRRHAEPRQHRIVSGGRRPEVCVFGDLLALVQRLQLRRRQHGVDVEVASGQVLVPAGGAAAGDGDDPCPVQPELPHRPSEERQPVEQLSAGAASPGSDDDRAVVRGHLLQQSGDDGLRRFAAPGLHPSRDAALASHPTPHTRGRPSSDSGEP